MIVYTDGLKVYTTIDSHMQKYAEEAVYKHVVEELQPLFDKELKSNKNAPYASSLSADEVAKKFQRAKHQCARYIQMKSDGYSESEIEDAFNTPTEMTVYTPHGEIDTVMTPSDSIKYYKRFLRTGFMVMDNETGYVKAYVGGTNFSHFQYDMCTQGRRQVGSTIKPYLYSLAMENGWSPCDEAPNIQQTYQVGNKTWTPRNGSRARYGEMVTLKWGLATSNNWISAWLMNQMSPSALVRLIHEYGVLNKDILPSYSINIFIITTNHTYPVEPIGSNKTVNRLADSHFVIIIYGCIILIIRSNKNRRNPIKLSQKASRLFLIQEPSYTSHCYDESIHFTYTTKIIHTIKHGIMLKNSLPEEVLHHQLTRKNRKSDATVFLYRSGYTIYDIFRKLI